MPDVRTDDMTDARRRRGRQATFGPLKLRPRRRTMSDITPIRFGSYEHLAVRALDAGNPPVEPSALADAPDDWDILAFIGATPRGGLLLLGKRKTGRAGV